jgi:plastocyanin
MSAHVKRPGLLFQSLALIVTSFTIISCSDSTSPKLAANVSVQDDCDPASFNAALGAGACTKQGNTTLSQFNTELNATQQVAAWRFVPANFTLSVGQSIAAKNDGGEMHTFTEVAQYGGGIVPALNNASGNTVEAPECQNLTSADFIAPGATFTTDPETSSGTELYQCCIHPWMRARVVSR